MMKRLLWKSHLCDDSKEDSERTVQVDDFAELFGDFESEDETVPARRQKHAPMAVTEGQLMMVNSYKGVQMRQELLDFLFGHKNPENGILTKSCGTKLQQMMNAVNLLIPAVQEPLILACVQGKVG